MTWDYFEIGWITYAGAGVSGIGGALLWTAQAVYIVLNSNLGSTHNGIGTFWILYQAR